MFDQTNAYQEYSTILEGTPIRYAENGTIMNYCYDDIENTSGQILLSNSLMLSQKSCKPNTGNAGNYYSWPAATAGGYHTTVGYNESNSVCPKGWKLTVNNETEVKSWYYLIRNTYSIKDSNDSKLLPPPMSFIRSGYYERGSLINRANYGLYWSSTAYDYKNYAYYLRFSSSVLNPQYYSTNVGKDYGFSVRCVSR